ncbi:MAG: phage tail protein [Paraprevotella sp.]|nr:phage tail protein [Paraprevotella sp.]
MSENKDYEDGGGISLYASDPSGDGSEPEGGGTAMTTISKVYVGMPDGKTAELPIGGGGGGKEFFINAPVGTILMYATVNIPDGWVFCDGRLLSNTTYPEYAAVVGTTYGGDSTRCATPMFAGRFALHGTPGLQGGNTLPNIWGKIAGNGCDFGMSYDGAFYGNSNRNSYGLSNQDANNNSWGIATNRIVAEGNVSPYFTCVAFIIKVL